MAPSETADATAPIQACIDQMGAAGGGIVLLRAGTYVLKTDHLRFIAGEHDRVRLRGVGELTVLRVDPALAKSAILIGADNLGFCQLRNDDDVTGGTPNQPVGGVSIEGIRIVGNQGNLDQILSCCPVDSPAWNACTRYVGPSLTRDGISVHCAENVRITGVVIANTSSSGILAEQTDGLLVDGASIEAPQEHCVVASDTERTVVRNVTCTVPGLSGLKADGGTTQMTLQQNTVLRVGQRFECPLEEGEVWEMPGVLLNNVSDSTIADNIIVGTTGRGIEMDASSRNIISLNHITGCDTGISLDSRQDVCSENGSSNNLLSGNIFDDNGTAVVGSCASGGNAASANICPDSTIRLTTEGGEGEGSCSCDDSQVLRVVAGPCIIDREEAPTVQ